MSNLNRERRLAEIGEQLYKLNREVGVNEESFVRLAREYAELSIGQIPYEVKEGFLKSKGLPTDDMDKVYRLTAFKYAGVMSYPVKFGAFEERYEERFNKKCEREKCLIIHLPTRDADVQGGGYTVVVYERVE